MKKKNNGRGVLGCLCLSEGDTSFKEILSEDFHLSYPNVFEYDGNIYMLPETFESNQLRLYKCVSFPDKWVLDWVMLEGVSLVDTTLYFDNGRVFAESHDIKINKNRFFEIDFKQKLIKEMTDITKPFVDRRPGGQFVEFNDGTYHVLQNCDKCYGEYLHIAKVNSFDGDGLDEQEIDIVKVSDVNLNNRTKFDRIHTYNKCDHYEVIDLLYNKHIYGKFIPSLVKYVKNRLVK